MCFNKNSFDLLLISFAFYIRNSLEKQTENSEVLLNWHINIKNTFGTKEFKWNSSVFYY